MDSTKAPTDPNHPPTTTELMASVKVVAEATRAKMNNEEYDQNKAAAAAAVVLNATSHYGKLDESTGLGKLLDKAEDFLHDYSTKTTTTQGADGQGNTSGDPKEGGEGGCPYGEYVKMAQALLK